MNTYNVIFDVDRIWIFCITKADSETEAKELARQELERTNKNHEVKFMSCRLLPDKRGVICEIHKD